MGRLSWVWASPPDAPLLALAERLERGDVPVEHEVYKHNRNRTVWRLTGDPAQLVLKHYRGRSGEALKTWLLGGRAEREFRAMEEFCHAGLPTARPVAYADRREGGALTESWLLSREVLGARSVQQALAALPPDGPEAVALALRVMDVVARLHQHAFWHRDLHAGNLLLDRDDCIVIIDLHSLWRVPVLSTRQRMENLGRLLFSLRASIDLGRVPELAQRYAEQRGQSGADVALTVVAVSRALKRFADDYVRGRSARAMRDSSEFVGSRGALGRLHRRREYGLELLAHDLDVHRAAEASGAGMLSAARASSVSWVDSLPAPAAGERPAAHAHISPAGPSDLAGLAGGAGVDEPGARVVKHYLPQGLMPLLRARLGLGRARGAWRFARRCRVLGVPTPQALAMLERPGGSAWLVTRAVVDATSLTDWGQALEARTLGALDRRAVAWAVGHAVGVLARAGLRHADMSGKNVLLSRAPAEPVVDLRLRPSPTWPRVNLVDLDNMRRCQPHDPEVLVRMLGQLGDLPPVITASDRRRFELGYLRGAGRELPAEVVAVARERTRARQQRRSRLEAARRST
ncbi:MAG: hypothetical protein DRQ55_02540 [Planctomycetota bacterium]|nr:MAG: hypothetical protein DRQ55_02540 [Planctomycetota bacterium]